MAALTAGQLEHRIAETGDDEFRDLAEAFNTMARRLSEQLTAKELAKLIAKESEGMPFRPLPLPPMLSQRPTFFG